MAFFPFTMAPMDSMESMQSCFQQQMEQNAHPVMAMGMPMMAHAQAQARGCWQRPRFASQRPGPSNSHNHDSAFHIDLDVQQFTPEEISVKMVDNQLVIEGNHEAREFGRISAARHFLHHYSVPEGVKFEDLTSSLSSDGVLTISAPKAQSKSGTNEKIIPITATGLPAKKTAAGDSSSSKGNSESKE